MTVFITGLQNAHVVENQALELMNRQVERIENYPEVSMSRPFDPSFIPR